MNRPEPPEQIKAMDTAEGHQRFLRAQWKKFAAYAWHKHLSEGRGAVVIDLRNARREGAGFNVPSQYVAEESRQLAKQGGWPDTDVAQVIEEYDPTQDVVFIFLRTNGEISYYQASDDPTPPEAFEIQMSGSKLEPSKD